jgi:hypothetical protein
MTSKIRVCSRNLGFTGRINFVLGTLALAFPAAYALHAGSNVGRNDGDPSIFSCETPPTFQIAKNSIRALQGQSLISDAEPIEVETADSIWNAIRAAKIPSEFEDSIGNSKVATIKGLPMSPEIWAFVSTLEKRKIDDDRHWLAGEFHQMKIAVLTSGRTGNPPFHGGVVFAPSDRPAKPRLKLFAIRPAETKNQLTTKMWSQGGCRIDPVPDSWQQVSASFINCEQKRSP